LKSNKKERKEVKQLLTAYDRAKYPFIGDTAAHVAEIGLDINELESVAFNQFLNRAEKRVKNALFNMSYYSKTVPKDDPKEYELEIFSFPIAIMLVVGTEESFIKSRYALAEAKRTSEMLRSEKKEKLLEIAETFNWNIELLPGSLSPYVFSIDFSSFLKNSINFHDETWKLVNQKMINGKVYLTQQKMSRLLEEEVRKYIEKKLDTKIKSFPLGITTRINQLRQLAAKKKEQIQLENLPKRVVIDAFPSCIKSIYDRVAAGRPVSHMGRFALTSFMLNVGMSGENVFKFFQSVSDFNERMTRYQIEHIAGTRGSGTKYTPPNCSTLRTHGICVSPEPECRKAVNPLVCYKKKLNNIPEENSINNTNFDKKGK
jgi:DNA primase large subunit